MLLHNYDKTTELLKTEQRQSRIQKVRIEFDGGTPCNIPARGYGNGYGSYQLASDGMTFPIVRCNFGVPMSNNVAEISTLIAALKAVSLAWNVTCTEIEIHGDSQNALARCLKARVQPSKTPPNPNYYGACAELFTLCQMFHKVTTHWRSRKVSVRLFGH